jgi:hypothetical protein
VTQPQQQLFDAGGTLTTQTDRQCRDATRRRSSNLTIHILCYDNCRVQPERKTRLRRRKARELASHKVVPSQPIILRQLYIRLVIDEKQQQHKTFILDIPEACESEAPSSANARTPPRPIQRAVDVIAGYMRKKVYQHRLSHNTDFKRTTVTRQTTHSTPEALLAPRNSTNNRAHR